MTSKPKKILLVAGARPNFMKIAPIVRQLRLRATESAPAEFQCRIVHTGQHYDYEMSRVFFDDLEIPEPDHYLNAGSGTHARQTARVMEAFETVCLRESPDVVVVVGDVNSTLACAVTAKKLHVDVAHVEAGLRSGDMDMPEEINRIVTDSIADYLFVTEKSGMENLRREGKGGEQVFFVGNVMIDTLFYQKEKGNRKEERGKSATIKKPGEPYGVVTLHRPSNVDVEPVLKGILRALVEISADMPIYYPVHPRARKQIERFGLLDLIQGSGIELMEPLSYRRFLGLWKDAALVLTDSGGLQEETTALGVPCFTIRENTERPITIEQGTNTLVGTTCHGILSAYNSFKNGNTKKGRVPELWDGKAAERIVDILTDRNKEIEKRKEGTSLKKCRRRMRP